MDQFHEVWQELRPKFGVAAASHPDSVTRDGLTDLHDVISSVMNAFSDVAAAVSQYGLG